MGLAKNIPSKQQRCPYRVQFKAAKESMLPGSSPTRWVQVGETGSHVYEGEHLELTEEHFEQFVSNFNAQVNPIPVYLNHEAAEAVGWILELKHDGGNMLARMEFADDVAEDIRAGRWGFTSMGFSLESVSRKDGKPIGAELFEVSLVNEPFLDGLQSLQSLNLSRSKGKRRVQMASTPRELIEKHLKEGGSLADIESALADIKDGAADEPASEPSSDVDMSAQGDDNDVEMQGGDEALAAGGEAIAMLMEATGLGPAEVLAALRDNLDAIASALGATSDTEGTPADVAASRDQTGDTTMSTENEALKIRLNALHKEVDKLKAERKERLEAKAEETVDNWVNEGRVLVSEREKALKLQRENPELAKDIFGDRQVVPRDDEPGDTVEVGEVKYTSLSARDKRNVDSLMRMPAMRRYSRDEVALRVVQSERRQAARGAN